MAHISDMALTNALKALQHAQIIDRRAYNEVPPRVEYSLSQLGQSMYPILDSMEQWGLAYKKWLADTAGGPENQPPGKRPQGQED